MKLRRTRRRARVEMMPLMDVVFLLLVFFIYSMLSMSAHRAMPLKLPASSQAEQAESRSQSLSISASGEIFLDKTTVSLDELTATLRALKAEKAEEELELKVFADGALSYQDLYRVLDAVRLAGVAKINLQARPEPLR